MTCRMMDRHNCCVTLETSLLNRHGADLPLSLLLAQQAAVDFPVVSP